MEDQKLTRQIIGCAYAVYNQLGSGFLESVYQRSMLIELQKIGLDAQNEEPIRVHYDGQVVGEFRADLMIQSKVIVELKAIETLVKAHEVQVVNYLRATGVEVGLLLNFGPTEVQVRRLTKTAPKNRDQKQSR